MSTTYKKKLIEVALPLQSINDSAAEEKSVPRHGHPQTLHLWWARRPLAAARAVLFAQLVDDPSSWTDLFPTEEAQNHERQRLFRLLEDLVRWENSNNETVINAARLEIARSHARSLSSPKAKAILAEGVNPQVVNQYLATELPPVHDPFAGGGTIPLEAQRLGLRAIATDLNPVAVMINKALIEIPPKFADMSPVSPESRTKDRLKTWKGAEGLAEDVRYYGTWMRDEARRRVGHLYPEVELPKDRGGRSAKVVAWLWARTVESPDPAFRGCHVPLVSNFWLSTKPGRKAWLNPIVSKASRTWRFEIATGEPDDDAVVAAGTKQGRGDFTCILSGAPIPAAYLRAAGKEKRLGCRMLAVVAEGKRGRSYLPVSDAMEALAAVPVPDAAPTTDLPDEALGFRVQNYGLTKHRDLFTPRQLTALTTFSELMQAARARVATDAQLAGVEDAQGYSDAVLVYLSFCLSKLADWSSSICGFIPGYEKYRDTFARPTISMTWDFAELNPFSDSVGNWLNHVEWVADVVASSPRNVTPGVARQMDAASFEGHSAIVSTDPPYYDNIGYADLSDFFYVWLRTALRDTFSDVCSTLLVPKQGELIASPHRHGGKSEADGFFLNGMRGVLARLANADDGPAPLTLYYAYRQSEDDDAGTSSTGWETFLSAVLEAGHSLLATLPIRSERTGRMRDVKSNALASSIVLVCRKRPDDAPTTTRGDFRRMLRKELPHALKPLQQGNIAPVDMGQACVGPGMAIFSRHKHVLEANGKPMTVQGGLQLINEVLDEYLSSGEGDFDADTRFAITWYELHGWGPGLFGDAENIAKARNVSVKGVEEAGICKSAAGKVRILRRHEMRPLDYDPTQDERPTIWEFTQHMIRNIEDEGEEAAARLLKKLGGAADATRELAYRLYNTCERKKWAEDARSYNSLILAWTELEKLAAKMGDEPPPTAPRNGANGKKQAAGKTPKGTKKQQSLFKGDG